MKNAGKSPNKTTRFWRSLRPRAEDSSCQRKFSKNIIMNQSHVLLGFLSLSHR